MNKRKGLLLVVIGIVCSGCPMSDSEDPGGSGVNHESRPCSYAGTSAWNNNLLQMEVSQPPCPFVVKAASDIVTYAARVTAPSTKVNSGGSSYVDAWVLKARDASTIASDTFNPYQQSPNDPTIYFADVSATGTPGLYPEPDTTTKLRDSLSAFSYYMASNGIAEGWKIIPGRIDATAQSVIGPAGVVSGGTGSWHSYPQWDTTAYRYKWVVDGVLQTGTGAWLSKSFTTGTHTVANVTIRADNTRDSIVKTVKSFVVTISGPSSVRPFATCEWTGSASGGTSPYSFAWTAAGASGSGSYFDYTNGSPSGSSFTVGLTATDASGTPVPVSRNVTVSSGAPICTF